MLVHREHAANHRFNAKHILNDEKQTQKAKEEKVQQHEENVPALSEPAS